ncbi:multidrug effflux MFS transporter [Shimia thalassica]|nr:multidrug effflux MFS transporter [Shimia thalassica]MDO6478189.1 multidrug effflux MFS transporter [Shimia thalassica]MDO6503040.1 multidrug effflux MFS transporter [Shimia thalassica]MDO6522352.1 multidrug effflux MFS transporter [Shimia thalassica]MDP2493938.1 multidrug effflux MFS transporter [Shimia thalassica]MDP2579591.1 multidrug effflux MFS transporter [Shimia thalassica]
MPASLTMSRSEFVALCAMMFATIAFSIDAMLPALPEIGRELSPDNLNRAQLILTSFVLGMGIGTLFTGPLSDAFGRKRILIGGALIYSVCAFVGWLSESLELVLAARLLQGVGAAGPRIVTLAIIRDLFSGREMARIVSFAMMIFTLVPAIAPSLGAVIIAFTGWRGVFLAFMVFSLISVLWVSIRLPEPLAIEDRRPFRLSLLLSGMKEMWAIPSVRISMLVQSFCFAILFGLISSVQQIYDITFGRGAEFPLWFGAIALVSGSASLLNAWLVVRVGMRYLVTVSLGVQIGLSAIMFIAAVMMDSGMAQFLIFVVWQTTVFFMAGMTLGNLNALAMEPLGHMAGTGASVMGAFATVLGGALAVPIGLAFDGTVVPVAAGICVASAFGFALMLWMKRLEERF